MGRNDVLYIHVTLVPYISAAGELKTKPTQHSVKQLRSIGITPDILVCRSEREISKEMREKISMFCDVDSDAVFQSITAESIYQVPLLLQAQGMDRVVLRKLDMEDRPADMEAWKEMVDKILTHHDKKSKIAIVGNYVELQDAYISIVEALKHASVYNNADVDIEYINASDLEEPGVNLDAVFEGVDGILIPGGFGDRGIEGMIRAAQYARENRIPFFGICLGMQCAVIEYARDVCGMKKANSTEFDEDTPYPVIYLMPEQVSIEIKGGTMRLGKYPCKLKEGTHAIAAYGTDLISERHRHRYEVNNELKEELFSHGLVQAGTLPNGKLTEIVELPESEHPWFVGVQFHPELKSRPTRPHPLFKAFIAAALANQKH